MVVHVVAENYCCCCCKIEHIVFSVCQTFCGFPADQYNSIRFYDRGESPVSHYNQQQSQV